MKFAVLDFETTGAQPDDQIIQVGLIIIEDQNITQTHASFINPQRSIPAFICELTGITAEMVEDAPLLHDLVPHWLPLLEDAVLVAHNAQFDAGFLQRALELSGYSPFSGKILDTLDLVRILFPEMGSLQLGSISRTLGIPHERPHQADSDAEATAHIFLNCMEKLEQLPLLTIQRLDRIFEDGSGLQRDLSWFFKQLRQAKEQQTVIDMHSGHYFRQFYLRKEEWAADQFERAQSDTEEWIDMPFSDFYSSLKPALRARFERFEEREAQDQMIAEVYACLEEGKHLLVEAGTGTGKSLGYLIPALHYSALSGSKTVVSTHTINLQEQIRQRDIPLLEHIFPFPFRVSVLKGRSHYLCLRKFEQKLSYSDYEYQADDRITAGQMTVWLGETEHGDNEELHFSGRSHEFWRTVESDTDSCLNRACPWFKRCFYHGARNSANQSDVVVTNHSLLMTDIKAENRLLPAYQQLVIDEAHHFEDVATKHLGLDAGYYSLINSLSYLAKDSRSGKLPALAAKLAAWQDEQIDDWRQTIEGLLGELVQVREVWDTLSGALFELLGNKSAAAANETGQLVLRLKADALPAGWQDIQLVEDNLFVLLSDVLKSLERLFGEIRERQEELDIEAVLTDLSGALSDLYRQRDTIRFIMKLNDAEYVYWLEASPHYKQKSIQLIAAPTIISPMLKQHFFDAKESVIMTSATLSVNQSFQYLCDQLGLEGAEQSGKLQTELLPSPFNYREQALVCIPRDFPSIRGNSDETFVNRLVASLREVALETGGKMMVLFTSYRMLRQVHEALSAKLFPLGLQVLGQGIDSASRSKLIALFQDNPASVLLGTSSFWEGIDIPGEALSCLAIVRLPFQPPNHPLVEAKCEALKNRNQNPFIKYSVPQAVIRFKQGFGRLVRTAQDKGIVIIYDTRVIDTSYGKYFLYSLPGPKIEHMPEKMLVTRIREWMKAEAFEKNGGIV